MTAAAAAIPSQRTPNDPNLTRIYDKVSVPGLRRLVARGVSGEM
jgi:hypothetical protein